MTDKQEYYYYRTFENNKNKRNSEGKIKGETPLKALENLVKEKGIFFCTILEGELKKDYLGRISNKRAQFLSESFIQAYLIPSTYSLMSEESRGTKGIIIYKLWENKDLLEGFKIEKIKYEGHTPWENGIYMTKEE